MECCFSFCFSDFLTLVLSLAAFGGPIPLCWSVQFHATGRGFHGLLHDGVGIWSLQASCSPGIDHEYGHSHSKEVQGRSYHVSGGVGLPTRGCSTTRTIGLLSQEEELGSLG